MTTAEQQVQQLANAINNLSFAPQYHTQITSGEFAGAWMLVCAPLGLSFTQAGWEQWMLEAADERKRIENEGAVTVMVDFKSEIGSHERLTAALENQQGIQFLPESERCSPVK